jgi:uncharacterized protein (DUF342 family)
MNKLSEIEDRVEELESKVKELERRIKELENPTGTKKSSGRPYVPEKIIKERKEKFDTWKKGKE